MREPEAPAGRYRGEAELIWSEAGNQRRHRVDHRVLLGSSPGAEVVIADPAVSRVHCHLEPREDGIWLTDINSRNGTLIESVRVREARVPDGAAISVGSTRLLLRYAREPRQVELWPTDRFGHLLGQSVVMRELFALLARVAESEVTVLVQGETGTGKELLARSLHDASPRATAPFAVVDCGALPDTLIETELFGYGRGAFTGAIDAHAGAIEAADGGTVFFDEIGELPFPLQSRLLRVIESRTVKRLGESRYRSVDVRFIAATNRDLLEMVNEGTFREDLYFRLAVMPLTLPPLRRRPEDVPLLVQHLLPPGARLSDEVAAELSRRPWFGNVRELKNAIDRLLVFGGNDWPPEAELPSLEVLPAVALDSPFKDIRQRWLDHLERCYLEGLLRLHGRSLARVAEASGLHRSHVNRLMRKHHL